MSNVAKIAIVVVLALVGICVYLWDSQTRRSAKEGVREEIPEIAKEDLLSDFTETPVTVGPPRETDTDIESTVGDAKPEAPPPVEVTPRKPVETQPRPVDPQPRLEEQPKKPIAGTLDTTPPAATEGFPKKYVVRAGDSLWKIAQQQYGDPTKYKDILQANRELLRGDADAIAVGMELTLPKIEVPSLPTITQPDYIAGWSGKTHKVASGETLSIIAKKYYNRESKWELIYNENKAIIGDDPGRLKVGMVLKIPELPAPVSPIVEEDLRGKKTYTVKERDSFWTISEKVYGDGNRWQALYEANKERLKLDDPADLKVGMVLIIPEIKEETE